MNALLLGLVSALALSPVAQAADERDGGRYLAQPFKGDYYVYGGNIGDPTPPTQKDRKWSLMLRGPIAKDLFDHIGPDAKGGCGTASDSRKRTKGDVECAWAKDDGYSCYFGINVRTGRSISVANC